MIQKSYNYVYVTINKINGKCYIGSHASNFSTDNYLCSGNLIVAAIKKYGKHQFIKIILSNYDSILSARLNEGAYIEKFDTIAPNGYNISPSGGSNFKDGIASEETKKKLSESHKGKKPSEETRKKLSKSLTGRKRNPDDAKKAWETKKQFGSYVTWNKGKTGIYSTETIKKISAARKGTHHTEESKIKTRNALKNRPLKVNNMKKECEYCGITTNLGNYDRWHGDKCKRK